MRREDSRRNEFNHSSPAARVTRCLQWRQVAVAARHCIVSNQRLSLTLVTRRPQAEPAVRSEKCEIFPEAARYAVCLGLLMSQVSLFASCAIAHPQVVSTTV